MYNIKRIKKTIKNKVGEENERKKSIVLSVRKVAEMEEKEEMEELLKIYGVGESN